METDGGFVRCSVALQEALDDSSGTAECQCGRHMSGWIVLQEEWVDSFAILKVS